MHKKNTLTLSNNSENAALLIDPKALWHVCPKRCGSCAVVVVPKALCF